MEELKNIEINKYIDEFIFIYNLYIINEKNYENTMEDIYLILTKNKKYFYNILTIIIDIDNNKYKFPLYNKELCIKIINIYKKEYKITYDNFIKIINNSYIIKKSGINFIKFYDIKLEQNDLKIIIQNDYNNDICLICLENIINYKSFRIFNCCFSKTCNYCYKLNELKCPICNQKSKTLVSFI